MSYHIHLKKEIPVAYEVQRSSPFKEIYLSYLYFILSLICMNCMNCNDIKCFFLAWIGRQFNTFHLTYSLLFISIRQIVDMVKFKKTKDFKLALIHININIWLNINQK